MNKQIEVIPEAEHPSAFVEGVFGASSKEEPELESSVENVLFSDMSDEEQVELIYEVQSLVAERRDLKRTLLKSNDDDQKGNQERAGQEESSEEVSLEGKGDQGGTEAIEESDKPKTLTSKLRRGIGRRRFPSPVVAKLKIGVAASDARDSARSRLAEVENRLHEIGTIPGIREAYGREVSKLYFYGRLLQERDRLLGEQADLGYAIRKRRASAKRSHAGVPVGADLELIATLERELSEVGKKLDDFSGARKRDEAQSISSEINKQRIQLGKVKQEISGIKQKISEIDPETGSDDEKARKASEKSTLEKKLQEKEGAADVIEEIISKQKERIRKISEGQSIGPFLDRIATLREYADSFQAGRIVELPSVEKLVGLGLESLRDHRAFTLAGHLGSGKTEVARHIAKLFMLENAIESGTIGPDESYEEAYDRMQLEFFSGSEEASVYDLVGKLKIRRENGKDVSPEKIAKLVAEKVEELKASSESVLGMSEDALNGLSERILERVLAASVSGGDMETVFAYGPLGRALKEGKPIILDEVNMIPPQVLGRMNDVALAAVGRKIVLQENGEEGLTVQSGFGIIGTFNVGRQYHGTQEFNVAQASRWNGPKVDYPSREESFDLVLSALIRKDRVRLPPQFRSEDYEKLIDLTIVVRHVQELFSGQTEGQRYMALRHGMRAEKTQLEKSVISTRDLLRKIILPWCDSGFREGSLDEIIADNILATAGTHSEDDQKLLVEIFLENGFFQGWDERRFREHHVVAVEDEDIQTIQGIMNEDEYRKNDPFHEIREEAHTRAGGDIRSMLFLGRE